MDHNAIDWNAVWKEQILKNRSFYNGGECLPGWDKESALQYWQMVEETQKERIEETINGIEFNADSRVLDIGSGPGVIAIPLSKRVAEVTTIDPSEGMIGVLRDKIREYGISNIKCIKKRWEDINVNPDLIPPYDVVIASLSLSMLDIRASIEKMLDAASKYIYLYWFAGEPSWDTQTRDILYLLHGKVFHPMPKSDILFNILYQMGIYPNIDVFLYRHINVFSSMDEALNYFGCRYAVSTEGQKSILRDYLMKILYEENGLLVLKSPATCLKIWWKAVEEKADTDIVRKSYSLNAEMAE